MRVSGRGESASGLLLGGQLALERAGARTWVVEVTASPFEVPSPVLDESFRAISFMVRRSFGSTLSVAPGIGFDHRVWSGPERVEDSDSGFTLGLNVGAPLPLSDRVHLLPEASFQTSGIELEGSVSALLLSVRVTLLVSPG